ncbi:MAG: BMP family ABC transporter substrate-binding protein [Clostridia bacterium]
MKKKSISVLLCVVALCCVFAFSGCDITPVPEKGYNYDAIPDTMTSTSGYELAVVTDVGQLKDKGFNQGTWEGLKRYAHENKISYKYYQPANGEQATDADRVAAMTAAINNGAKVIVTPGFLQSTALTQVAPENPDVKFVFIDGEIKDMRINKDNISGVSFSEQESGYFAGYASVMEGYKNLGFMGGGSGTNPAVNRFGWGFIQGANAAALEKKVNVKMKFSFKYGQSFASSGELQTMANGWYNDGTETIFCCGGSMFDSIKAAAAVNRDAKVIGVDVDQSNESDRVITSAIKGLREAVVRCLETIYANNWQAELGGKDIILSAKDDATGLLPGEEFWMLKNFTYAQYQELFQKVVKGTIVIDKTLPELTSGALSLDKVVVDYVK